MRIISRRWPYMAVAASALVLALLLVGGLTRAVQPEKSTYDQLKTFTEVLSLIQDNYVEPVDDQKLIYGAIKGMLDTLDPHSSFLPPDVYREIKVETEGKFGGLGIEITMRNEVLTVVSPIEDTPAYRAGIKAGDQILKVEGEPTKKMSLMEAVKKMRGPKGTKVTISIMREGLEEPKDFTIVRDIIRIKSVRSRMLEDGLGYVRIRTFHKTTSKELDRALDRLGKKGMKALVLDLRNNPGGLLRQAVDVADAFLDEGSLVVYTKGRLQNQNLRFPTSKGGLLEMPMVVLVNGGSASASEIVSGALQDLGRAVILGTQTFGKGSVQSIVPLSDGSGLRLTTAHYYTPKGRLIQGKGITPDIVVPILSPPAAAKPAPPPSEETQEKKPEESPSAEEQDPQLKRAIEILKSWDIFKKGVSRGALPKAS